MDRRWIILAVLFLLRVAVGLQFQAIGALEGPLVAAFGLDGAGFGALVGSFMIPGVVMALVAGHLAARIGDKPAVLIGLCLMAVTGLAASQIDAYPVQVALRALSGTGAVMVFVVSTKMTVDWFINRELTLALAVSISGQPVGMGTALATIPAIAAGYGWQVGVAVPGAFAAVAAVLLAVIYRTPDDALPPSRTVTPFTREEIILVTAAGILMGFYVGPYLAMLSFTPGYLKGAGMDGLLVDQLMTLQGLSPIVAMPLGGWIAARFGAPNTVITVGIALWAGALMLIGWSGVLGLTAAMLVPALVAMSIMGPTPQGSIQALPAEALRPETRARGMGLFLTFFYGAAFVMPTLAGWSRDATGWEAAPVVTSASLSFAGILTLGLFRLLQARLKPAAA